jgi:hypothetical protein
LEIKGYCAKGEQNKGEIEIPCKMSLELSSIKQADTRTSQAAKVTLKTSPTSRFITPVVNDSSIHSSPLLTECLHAVKVRRFKVKSEDGEEELAAPLLVSDSSEELGDLKMELSSGADDHGPIDRGPSYSSGPSERQHWLQPRIYQLLQTRTAADALPNMFQVIVTSGKMSGVVFLGGYLLFLALWIPIYLFSCLVGESGIYVLTISTIFLVGRSIIRMLAFPGSTTRVSSEIEKEFSKYSNRMLMSSATSIIDLAQGILSAAKTGGNDSSSNSTVAYHELPTLWKRAKSYRDRVIAVYVEVLQYIYDEARTDAPPSLQSDLTKYGNNKMSGDIGDLSGLTVSLVCSFLLVFMT